MRHFFPSLIIDLKKWLKVEIARSQNGENRINIKTHSTVSDPLSFGDCIPDLFGVLEWTGEGPLLPKLGLALEQKSKLHSIVELKKLSL